MSKLFKYKFHFQSCVRVSLVIVGLLITNYFVHINHNLNATGNETLIGELYNAASDKKSELRELDRIYIKFLKYKLEQDTRQSAMLKATLHMTSIVVFFLAWWLWIEIRDLKRKTDSSGS